MVYFENKKMRTINLAKDPVDINCYMLYTMIPGLDTCVVSKPDKKKLALIITMMSLDST